jgi:hypothetical protein
VRLRPNRGFPRRPACDVKSVVRFDHESTKVATDQRPLRQALPHRRPAAPLEKRSPPDPSPRTLDPLLIGELKQDRVAKYYLIHQFDLTAAEQYLVCHTFLIVGSDRSVHTVIDVKPDNI